MSCDYLSIWIWIRPRYLLAVFSIFRWCIV
nr:MAG TPA: hypothetical protein [Caudoviricetes sp.]DAP19865.1 MAG TPA: hypothetical protein [Caudoviricetes sp.]DAY32172.1 MAG TPA: hypothetical protein [Caudoviricetes sp.]